MFLCSDILAVTVLCLKKIYKIYILDLCTISGRKKTKTLKNIFTSFYCRYIWTLPVKVNVHLTLNKRIVLFITDLLILQLIKIEPIENKINI